MARKNRTPEEKARREKIRELLQLANIGSTDNSRNGHSSKTLRTSFGDIEVSVSRDRKGEFEPQVLKKNYHVRSKEQIVKKAVSIAIGLNLDGRKDVLGMWVGENESAKFWATVLNGLKNRGVEDIFIASRISPEMIFI